MNDHAELFACPSVVTFELDDELVLYSKRLQSIFAINATASHLWRSVEAGTVFGDAIARFSEANGVSAERSREDIQKIVADWSRAGLLDGTQDKCTGSPGKAAGLSVRMSQPSADPGHARAGRGVELGILDASFEIGSMDSELLAELASALGHLVDNSAMGRAETIRLWLQLEGGEWQLREGSSVLATCPDRENLIPLVYTFVHLLAYLRSSCFAAVHGAAVCDATRCILMPGKSGSGKSTLAAALVADGMACCTDDMAVLSSSPIELRTFPSRIALKEGSWEVLRDRVPEIDQFPPYERGDGLRVKYVLPRFQCSPRVPEANIPVTHLVFPTYTPNGGNRLTSISRVTALSLLTEAGYDRPGRLSEAWVEALVSWIRNISCFSLEFGSLDEGAGLVGALA